MLVHGADIRFVQEMLGHKRLETTLIYTHVSIEKLKKVHRDTHPAELSWRKERDREQPRTAVTPADVTAMREKLGGDRMKLARLVNVSEQTILELESGARTTKGPLLRLVQLLWLDPSLANQFRSLTCD